MAAVTSGAVEVFVTVDRVEGLFDQRIPWRPYRRVPFAGHGVAACVVLEVSGKLRHQQQTDAKGQGLRERWREEEARRLGDLSVTSHLPC